MSHKPQCQVCTYKEEHKEAKLDTQPAPFIYAVETIIFQNGDWVVVFVIYKHNIITDSIGCASELI